jgi:uncharacterized membrane protein YcaP (DUF421 family)
MFFESWAGLGRIFVVGVLGYVALIVLLRISGKRTLSKMNAFDFIVTVALGSTLGSLLLSKDVPLAEGVLAFAVLIGLQLVATWLSVRSATFKKLIKSQPTLLLYKGELARDAMARERVTEEEVRAAVREQGVSALEDVGAVVLETAGELSVIPGVITERSSSLEGVRGEDDIGSPALVEVPR